MVQIGVDLGGHVLHIGVVDKKKIIAAAHLSLKEKEHDPKAMDRLLKDAVAYIKSYKPEKVTLERALVFPSRAAFSVFQMAEMMAITKLACHSAKVPLVLVTPSQWRKNVLGNGKADKKDALNFVKKKGWITKDHNEAESICIAFYQ